MRGLQTTFAELGQLAGKKTRRERTLETLDALVPWAAWASIVEPFWSDPQGAGRRRTPAETMLRMTVVQRLWNLSDEECEDLCVDSRAAAAFLGAAKVPDKTTLCKFRAALVENGLGQEIFEDLAARLEGAGLMLREGSVVDATFVESPSSTKNAQGARDPEAHSAKKGNNWHFGYKAHAGADKDSGLVHSLEVTAANVADIERAKDVVRPCDAEVYLDAGYTGLGKRPEASEEGGALHGKALFVNAKRSKVETDEDRFREHAYSQVRSLSEHPFHVVKDVMRGRSTRYKGLAKVSQSLYLDFSIANLLMLGRERVRAIAAAVGAPPGALLSPTAGATA